MANTAIIYAHQEDIQGGNYITWPAANLTVSLGDQVLAYRGTGPLDAGQQYVTLTGENGNILRFGAYWNGLYGGSSSFSNGSPNNGSFTTNAHTRFYSGPYCSAAPGDIDLEDEAFHDVEILETMDYFADWWTGAVPTHPRSGPQLVHGGHIAANALGLTHLAQSTAARGHFTPGSLECLTSGGSLVFKTSSLSEKVYFVTDDHTGDGGARAGGYYIIDPQTHPVGDPAYATSIMLSGTTGDGGNPNMMGWPGGLPGGSVLAFMRLFPGAGGSQAAIASGGSLQPATTYYVRFCYRTSATISPTTQTIETPMSPYMAITTASDGIAHHSLQFVLPSPPTYQGRTWTLALYMTTGTSGAGGNWAMQINPTQYTVTGSTVTITNYATQSSANQGPSFGFSTWPGAANFVSDPKIDALLMRWGILGSAIDAITGKWQIYSFNDSAAGQNTGVIPGSVIQPSHLKATNSPSGGFSPNFDTTTGEFTWASSGVLDANGHFLPGGNAITVSNVAFSAYWGSITGFTVTGTDNAFTIAFTSGTLVASGVPTITVTFAKPYANVNYWVLITPYQANAAAYANPVVSSGAADAVSLFVSSKTTTAVTFQCNGDLQSTAFYRWDFHVIASAV